MFFFFIFIILIIILSWLGIFTFKTQTATSEFKNQDYTLTINNFLNQKTFPANLLKGEKDETLSFLDILSYDLSRIDSEKESIFKRETVRDKFLEYSSMLNFKLSYKNNEFVFPGSKKKLKNCVPVVSDPGFFSFSVPVFYYDSEGNLVSDVVVFSNLNPRYVGDAFSVKPDFVPEEQRLCVVV